MWVQFLCSHRHPMEFYTNHLVCLVQVFKILHPPLPHQCLKPLGAHPVKNTLWRARHQSCTGIKHLASVKESLLSSNTRRNRHCSIQDFSVWRTHLGVRSMIAILPSNLLSWTLDFCPLPKAVPVPRFQGMREEDGKCKWINMGWEGETIPPTECVMFCTDGT